MRVAIAGMQADPVDDRARAFREMLPELWTPQRTPSFTVELSSVGNPDFREFYGKGILSPNLNASADSLYDLVAMAQAYIQHFDLGGGNWSGGEVRSRDGIVIGRISYNGRVWTPEDFRKCREIDPATGGIMKVVRSH
jgi:hypothetical protein